MQGLTLAHRQNKDYPNGNSSGDLTPPHTPYSGKTPRASDLSNRKLAHNQTELSRQITELCSAVEIQSHLLERILHALDDRTAKGKLVDRR